MKWTIVLLCLFGQSFYESEAKPEMENEVKFRDASTLFRNRQSCPPCKCGIPKIKKRIIGGVVAEITEFPWMVYFESNNAKGAYPCGATVISNKYILTAAHCLIADVNKSFVMLHLDNKHDLSNMVIKKVAKLIPHPEWNINKHFENDIALVELEDPIDFTVPMDSPKYITPVCLAEPGENFVGQEAIAVGWGLLDGKNATSNAEILQKTNLPIIDDVNCIIKFTNYYHRDSMICTGFSNGKQGVCQGDSGGPIHVYNPTTGSYVQPGLVSFVKKFCVSYGAFTDTGAYRDWIAQHTSDACFCDRPN